MPQAKDSKEFLTPPVIAHLLGVDHMKVIGWIRSGELRAYDLSAGRGTRPRYSVARTDLDEFLKRRATTPRPKTTPLPRGIDRDGDLYY